MGDAGRLWEYIETWRSAVDDFVSLCRSLNPDDWAAPTDLAGWDVKAIVSHVAHLEGILAGGPEETAEVGEPEHVTSLMGAYTEIGVVNRRDRDPAEILDEIERVTAARWENLEASPPQNPKDPADPTIGGMPWTWEVLLRNRPLDIWMHEQDIRRAVDRPGGLDTRAAQHTADYLTESFGFVLAKRAGAAPGTSATLAVMDSEPVTFEVNDEGRGRAASIAEPDVRLTMDREEFILLAGGRRALPPEAVKIEGDADLGETILAAMATVP